MLVLSRYIDGKIYIGDEIEVTVVDIDRGKVRLGIDAPSHVLIYRDNNIEEPERRLRRTRHKKCIGVVEVLTRYMEMSKEEHKQLHELMNDYREARTEESLDKLEEMVRWYLLQ